MVKNRIKNRIKNRWITGVLATVMAISGIAIAQTALPNLGDGTDLTPAAERKIGDRIARQLYRDPDYVDDPILGEYVQGIWQPLLAAARQRGELPPELDEAYAWEILLARDSSVNAFALPGAYFGLHLGLIGVVGSRDELASVLAHELSHVTQRHIARRLAKDDQQSPFIVGAMILALLAASKDPNSANAVQAANAAIVGGQALGAQSQLNFSRDMEREADRIGFAISTQAGFAPQGFVTMFEKLQKATRLNDSGNFPYLRSHPLTTERMADMESRIGIGVGVGVGVGVDSAVNEIDHALMSARARVGAKTFLEKNDNTPETLYGSALSAMKLREFAQAEKQWKALTILVQKNAAAARLARLLGVEIYIAQGNSAQALQLLGMPRGRAELWLWAQANPALKGVAQALQTWVSEHPRDALAWQELSRVYAQQGLNIASIRALAESFVAQLDYSAALARFKAAGAMVEKDHFEASIIDTRIRQLEALLALENRLER